MHSFAALSKIFEEKFATRHFPEHTKTLYDPAQYILGIGGKRIRPVCVLLANELFDDITPDAYYAAAAIELFHNFSLIHDDIMDKAPVRRGMATVHTKYGESTALLAGDVMLVKAYEYLNKVDAAHLHKVLQLFNTTAAEVCEGQQLDMDFEHRETVSLEEYLEMIALKTSVLVAASMKMGAILGGAGEGSQNHLYEMGKNLGIAFQVQDDYLDAFGDPEKFGKQVGGDILANKKTFLLIQALQTASAEDKKVLQQLLQSNPANKVQEVLHIFKRCKVDEWATQLQEQYYQKAMQHLEDTPVVSARKQPLKELADYLMTRQS
ncbi:MAG: polyprenyl synthetase family protein [Bacteroidetes bacterium]|nr:polyprenyl synthetase family protein [Bacteroidota bacterium]